MARCSATATAPRAGGPCWRTSDEVGTAEGEGGGGYEPLVSARARAVGGGAPAAVGGQRTAVAGWPTAVGEGMLCTRARGAVTPINYPHTPTMHAHAKHGDPSIPQRGLSARISIAPCRSSPTPDKCVPVACVQIARPTHQPNSETKRSRWSFPSLTTAAQRHGRNGVRKTPGDGGKCEGFLFGRAQSGGEMFGTMPQK